MDLPLILVGGSLMSETLFVALVLGSVLAALRSGTAGRPVAWAAGAGVLIGLATLTRPTALVLAIPLGVAVAGRSPRRPAAALVLVVAMALTIAPWTVRNAVQMHAFIPVSDFTGSWVAGTYNDQARADEEHPGSSQTFVAGEFDDLEGVPEVRAPAGADAARARVRRRPSRLRRAGPAAQHHAAASTSRGRAGGGARGGR